MFVLAKITGLLAVTSAFLMSPLPEPTRLSDGFSIKGDLPEITEMQLASGAEANPYPEDYVADIAYVDDTENCDEEEMESPVADLKVDREPNPASRSALN